MMLLIDTCFWSHAHQLFLAKIWDIRPILTHFRLGSTEEVSKELYHFNLHHFVPIDRILLVSVLENDYMTYQRYIPPLDRTDQSLLIAMRKISHEEPILLTDDGELLSEVLQTNLSGMKLPVFVLWLVWNALVEKKIGAKCIRFWEKQKQFKKKEISRWKKELHIIS